MLYKSGEDPKSSINHKSISLLNTMDKVLEKLLLNRLKIYIIPNIHPEQHDFWPQHSTISQLNILLDNVTNGLNLRHRTAASLLDIEKAFDKMWHDHLLFKLLAMNIPNQLTNFII